MSVVRVVDDMVGALSRDQLLSLVRARGPDHGQSRIFRPLDSGDTDTAGRSVNKDCFAGDTRRFLKQGTVRRRIRRPDSGSLFEAHVVGQTSEMLFLA